MLQPYPLLFGGAVEKKKIINEILTREGTTPIEHLVNSVIHRPVVNKSTYFFVKSKYTSQADLIYYPQGSTRYKYILIIVDIVSRYLAAVPIENKRAQTVTAALKKIFDDGFETRILYTDSGSEFNNRSVKQLLASRDIILRLTVPGRHNQLAIVDSYISILNNILVGIHSYRDLIARQNGIRQRDVTKYNWVDNLPIAVEEINKSNESDGRFEDDIVGKIEKYKEFEPIIGENEEIIPVGTKVYPPYLFPTDVLTGKRAATFERGKFREGDIRFNVDKPYSIGFVSLRLGQPIRYLLNDPNGKLIRNISYLGKELQLAE